MNHVMLDLETFGLGPTAAIVQIGAVAFDFAANTLDDCFERQISLQSSLMAGGTIDDATVAWWCKRWNNREARPIEIDAHSLEDVLPAFSDFFRKVGDPKDTCIWSHGAAFDIPILEHAYCCVHGTVPWHYRNVRDTRTIFALAKELTGWEMPPQKTAHTALADAIAQAKTLRAAYHALTSRGMSQEDANVHFREGYDVAVSTLKTAAHHQAVSLLEFSRPEAAK